MPSPTVEYANIPLPEVRVTTTRLLGAETTEKILCLIDKIENLRQINMKGENLPRMISSGPAKGNLNNHSERRIINVNGHEVELRCLVGDFFIELSVVEDDEIEATVEKIKAAFDQVIPDNYTIDIGRYSKYRPSLHDYRSA
ncbi:MAG: methyl-coenzyme M reductase operon protein D [archaeon]|nr:methyl-coenzyme M reductase operon protein D [archaeon]